MSAMAWLRALCCLGRLRRSTRRAASPPSTTAGSFFTAAAGFTTRFAACHSRLLYPQEVARHNKAHLGQDDASEGEVGTGLELHFSVGVN